jgi:DNA polymerase III alpha subunit
MIPLFKSHFSIGKSILTLSEEESAGKSDGIFNIAKNNGLTEVVLVEDSLTGFLEAAKRSGDLGMQLVFGLRVTACDTHSTEKDCHKVVVFAKDDEGCKLLNKVYTKAFERELGAIEMDELASIWNDEHLKLVIPFYDSFIFNNTMSFSNCVPDFNFTSPTLFIEDNHLPFDTLIKERVQKFASKKSLSTEAAKTIYYKNRDDFEAFQTYKCTCNRTGWGGRAVSIQKPNLDHCGSREFCVESWKENV